MNLGQISSCSRWKSKPQSFKSVFFFHVFQISKGNSQYHKIFKELSKEEQLIQSESVMISHLKCWLRGKIRAKNVNYILTSPILVCLFCKTVSAQLQCAVNEFLFFCPLFVRLHLCSAERHPLPRTDVCLRPLDLLPLQSVWQRHQGTGAAVFTSPRRRRATRPFVKCENDVFGWFPPDDVILGQIAIPVMSVAHIKKTKTAILVPNALVIATASDKVRRSAHREVTTQKPRLLKEQEGNS